MFCHGSKPPQYPRVTLVVSWCLVALLLPETLLGAPSEAWGLHCHGMRCYGIPGLLHHLKMPYGILNLSLATNPRY